MAISIGRIIPSIPPVAGGVKGTRLRFQCSLKMRLADCPWFQPIDARVAGKSLSGTSALKITPRDGLA
jgi:hypothetical protein